MRTAAAASLLLLAGCAGAAEPAVWVAPGTSAPAASSAGLAGDCRAVDAAFRRMLVGLLQNAVPGEGTGDRQAASRKVLTGYATATRERAAEVTDPALRTALEHHAAAAQKLSEAADLTDLDAPDLEKAGAEIETVCAPLLKPSATPGTPTTVLGAAGSGCELPVSFEVLPLWRPKAVDLTGLGELADLYRNGPFEAVCEVDAKPAGEVGFLRVYVAPGRKGSPRAHLRAFIAGESPEARKAGNVEMGNPDYADATIGGRPAAEVTYEMDNKPMEHSSKYSVFALNTPGGAVIVKLAPFGADEHANVLPAYEKAKETLTVR